MAIELDAPVPVDRLALRHGHPAAGWLVVFMGGPAEYPVGEESAVMGVTGPLCGAWRVNNSLFPTEAAAVAYARGVDRSWGPVVKAIRAAASNL
jgi:hypothetical protein